MGGPPQGLIRAQNRIQRKCKLDGVKVLSKLLYLRTVHWLFLLQLVELSKAQDVEAGDGTTTVVIIAGSLLSASAKLLEKGAQ